MASITTEKEEVSTRLKVVESEVKHKEEALKDAQARIEAHDSQARAAELALQEMVSKLESSLREKQDQEDAWTLRIAQLERRDETSRLLVDELQKKVGATLSSEEERVSSLSTELQKEHENCARLAADLQSMHAKLTKETLRADSLQNVLTATNENHMSERLEMTERVNVANKRSTTLEKLLETQREESRVTMQQIKLSLASEEEQKKKLEAELARVKQLNEELTARESAALAQWETEMMALKNQLAKQEEMSLTTLQEQHRIQLEALKGDHNDRSAYLLSKEEKMSNRIQQLEADNEGLVEAHAAEKSNLEQALEDAVAELDLRERRLASLEQENKEATERYTAKVNNARSAHDLELMELKGAHAAQLESELYKQKQLLTDQHMAAIEKVESNLKLQAEQSISSVVAREEVRVTELLGTVKQLEGQKATLVLELSSLQATYASQKEALEEEHDVVLKEKGRRSAWSRPI